MAAEQARLAADPPEINVATVRRLLELGEMLTSVLTRDEMEEIQIAYDLQKSALSGHACQTGNIIGT